VVIGGRCGRCVDWEGAEVGGEGRNGWLWVVVVVVVVMLVVGDAGGGGPSRSCGYFRGSLDVVER